MLIDLHLECESELGAPQPAVALLLGVVEDELLTKGISNDLYVSFLKLNQSKGSKVISKV